jgi:hypothetical protein
VKRDLASLRDGPFRKTRPRFGRVLSRNWFTTDMRGFTNPPSSQSRLAHTTHPPTHTRTPTTSKHIESALTPRNNTSWPSL